MNIKNWAKFILLSLSMLSYMGCSEDEPITPTPKYETGVFIANEGPFNTGSGTITFFNPDDQSTVQQVFEMENGRPIGNILNSVEIFNDKVYLVANNAGKVEVADAGTFKSVGTINDLQGPRYFLGIDSTKGYVSQWGADGLTGSVKVIDLTSNTVIKTIPTGKGPEKMIRKGDFVVVVNSGGFGIDSTLTVIDITTDEVNQTITVGENPNSIQFFGANFLVLCGGINDFISPSNSTPGSVWRISGFSPANLFTFPSNMDHPVDLLESSDERYFCLNQGKIHEIIFDGLNVSLSAPLLNKSFYSIEINTATDQFYGADPIDYISDGLVFRIQKNGTLIDSFSVGVIPSNFAFKN